MKGTTIVRFSSLEGLEIGLPSPVVLVRPFGDGRGRCDSPSLDLLLTVELAPDEGPAAAGVFGLVTVDDLALEGLSAGLMLGVACAPALLAAYGSAVAGRASSGLRGRLTGADIRDPEVELLGARVRVGRSRVVAAEARAGLAVPDLPGPGRPAEEMDVIGERTDCAEVGRSGMAFAAAAARLCAAIASLTDARPLKAGLALALLETDEAKELAFGLFLSLSRSCFDFASRLSMILKPSLAKPGL